MAPRPRSFLTRLTRAPARPEVEEIARNLEHVLNTRKACAVIGEVGLGDYERAPNTHDAMLALSEEIEQVVRRCEPRVCDPRVALLGGHGYAMVRLELSGAVRGEARSFCLALNTTTREVEISIIGELRR